MYIRLLFLAALALAVTAECAASPFDTAPASPETADSQDGDADPAPDLKVGGASSADLSFKVGCDWFPAFDSQNSNFAFPDTTATYWIAVGPSNPTQDMQLRIDGQYLAARYFSLHVYDGKGHPEDHLADYQILPEPSQQSTFEGATERSGARSGGGYEAFVDFADAPTSRQPNTLYRGIEPPTGAKKKNRTYLMLRVYIPADGVSEDGGYNLPRLVLHTATGDTPLANSPDTESCHKLYNSYRQYVSGGHKTAIPAEPANPPKFKSYTGNALRTGVFQNLDSSYIFATTSLSHGELQLVRGQAPTFTDQNTRSADPQLRYWSICQNDYKTEKVSACMRDRDAALDPDGYYTVVIADPADRPFNATTAHGFNFLPFGNDVNDGAIILRNIIPNPSFDQSAQDVPAGSSPSTTMGNYAPQATYCSRATFEHAAGLSPAAVFETCQADSKRLRR